MRGPRRLLLLLLAGGALAAILLTFLWPRDREPHYQGKPLTHWLETYFLNNRIGAQAQAKEAELAVREIGTNALPCLLKWISYEPPRWKTRLNNWLGNLPSVISESPVPGFLTGVEAAEDKRSAAEGAFYILGPQANSAIPELSRLLREAKWAPVTASAMKSLAYIGNDAILTLASTLTNQQVTMREALPYEFARLAGRGKDVSVAVPPLIQCLRDTNEVLAVNAAATLGNLGLDPETVVPCLVDGLKDSRQPVRRSSAASLGRFGTRAAPAAPALARLLNDPDPTLRAIVTNALHDIAPEALETSSQKN